jgi:hypothetical protein
MAALPKCLPTVARLRAPLCHSGFEPQKAFQPKYALKSYINTEVRLLYQEWSQTATESRWCKPNSSNKLKFGWLGGTLSPRVHCRLESCRALFLLSTFQLSWLRFFHNFFTLVRRILGSNAKKGHDPHSPSGTTALPMCLPTATMPIWVRTPERLSTKKTCS